MQQSNKGQIILFIKGILLGLAMVIPGVSFALIAIVLKLYSDILTSISELKTNSKKSFVFLLPIGLGVIIGFIIGLLALKFLINKYLFIMICFFLGIMVSQALNFNLDGKKEPLKKGNYCFYIGLLIPLVFTTISFIMHIDNSNVLNNITFINVLLLLLIGFLVGASQIIPGLSATVFLMLFGVLEAILNTLDVKLLFNNPIIIFNLGLIFIGALIGIFVFSKIMKSFIKTNPRNAYYLLFGFMISSLISMFYNIEMFNYFNLTWNNTNTIVIDILLGIILFISSFSICVMINKRIKKTLQN